MASCVDRTSVVTGVLRTICSLTIRSMRSSSSRRHRLEVDEVEPQPIGRDERARLLDVRAEHLAQRRVEQVRRRVVPARRVANAGVDFGGDEVARRAACPRSTRTRCARGSPGPIRARPSTVADASVGFADDASRSPTPVRRLRGRTASSPARRIRAVRRTATSTGCRCSSNSATTGTPFTRRRRVAFELIADAFAARRSRRPRAARSPRLSSRRRTTLPVARLVALPFHRAVVAGLIDAHVLRRRGVFDEVVRHAERVVETEGDVAREDALRRLERFRDLRFESRQAVGQHRFEAVLFGEDRLFDRLAVAPQLGIGVAHLAVEHVDEPCRNGSVKPRCLPCRMARRMILRRT